MDNVKRILDFIDNMSSPEDVAPQEQLKPVEQVEQQQEETIKETPQEPKAQNEDIKPLAYNLDNIHENDKGYKAFRNRLNRIKTYPKTLKIYGEEYITIKSPEELATIKQTITNNKKLLNQQIRSEKLKNSKLNVSQLQDLEEDETTYRQNNYIYKQPQPIGIVDNEDKPKRLPKTNKKDRELIFSDISTNKENLKQLVQDKDNFETLTEQYLSEDMKPIYKQHKDNDIIRDDTWTYDNFINIIDRMRSEALHKQPPSQPTKATKRNQKVIQQDTESYGLANYGLNPLLLQRRG